MRKTIANKGKRPTTLTRGAVRRIARAVNAYERGDRDVPGRKFRRYGVGEGVGSGLLLGKTTTAWEKGSLATIDLYGAGTPLGEAQGDTPETLTGCVNKFADVGSGKWVMVALLENDSWYLIAAEC